MTARADSRYNGFTIIELLVVIVVIGILAAITIVSFNGVQQKARITVLQSDLRNSSDVLKIDSIESGAYPATTASANGGAGLKASAGTTYQYTVVNSTNPPTFCLTATNGSLAYYITQDSVPTAGLCSGHTAP